MMTAAAVLAGALVTSVVSMASPASAAPLSPAATAAAWPPARPAVEVCGDGAALVRPSSMVLTCADHGMIAERLRWSRWTRTRATATGIVTWRAYSNHWDSTTADVTLKDPVREPGKRVLFTRLDMHVTGRTPPRFMRNVAFNEAPVPKVPAAPQASGPPAALPSQMSAAPSGTLGYAQIEGFWVDAGGPSGSDGSYTYPQIAAAITYCESSYEPGAIQPDEPYSTTGWGLWQITPGNSVPQYGTDFQVLDPWNNAEEAVYKYDAAGGFSPWTTYVDGCYSPNLQTTSADTALTDPGEYVQAGSAPSGTPSSPAADPGSTYGPPMPGLTAFQANTGHLFTYDPATNGHVDSNLGMAAGTSPSIAAGSGGYAVAFQANTGHLFTYNPQTNGNVDSNLGMAAGTSPSIAAGSGGYEVAFQANTGQLYIYNPQTNASFDSNLGMAAGTSPSIAASPGGGFEVAFQANTGHLFTYNPQTNGNVDSNLGMAAGTSPSIAASPGGGFEVAFQANTGHLFTWDPATNGNVDSNLGMAAGTSPSIAAWPITGFEVAFQANTGHQYIYNQATNGSFDSNLGMAAGTSPSIAN
jgi:hypothetical protein